MVLGCGIDLKYTLSQDKASRREIFLRISSGLNLF